MVEVSEIGGAKPEEETYSFSLEDMLMIGKLTGRRHFSQGFL